jgi:hypothetical protein
MCQLATLLPKLRRVTITQHYIDRYKHTSYILN